MYVNMPAACNIWFTDPYGNDEDDRLRQTVSGGAGDGILDAGHRHGYGRRELGQGRAGQGKNKG
jgi:hypothetical protein